MEPLLAALGVDPEADPSSAARERRIFTAVAGLMAITFLTILGSALATGEELVRSRIVGLGVLGSLLLGVLIVAFRRTLLRNHYHRRVLFTLMTIAVFSASQRIFGLLHGAPLIVVIVDTIHLIAAVSLMAAIFFVRWTAVITGYCAVALVLAYLAPGLYPSVLLLFLPGTMITFGYLWRRDALRGTA